MASRLAKKAAKPSHPIPTCSLHSFHLQGASGERGGATEGERKPSPSLQEAKATLIPKPEGRELKAPADQHHSISIAHAKHCKDINRVRHHGRIPNRSVS